MNDYLAQHPDIFMAKKEIHYFGSDLKTKQKITEIEYLKYFDAAGNKKVIGEASVWYLYSKTASEEIKRFSPGAKILVMLRNPVDVLHSMHSQHLYDANEDVQDFETALKLDEERKKGRNLPNSVDFFELPPYRESVSFAGQVKRYLDSFGKDNVHIIVYDDFVADTKKAVTETLQFLGLANKVQINYNVVNPNKKVRSLSLHRILKNPSPRLKETIRTIVPFKKIRHQVMSLLFKWNTIFKKRDEMGENLRETLKESFRDDITSLGRIINRDLSAWL